MDLKKLVLTQLRDRLTFSVLVKIFVDVAKGLQHLNQHNIVHCDLKPANILLKHIDGEYHACITDFGLSEYRLRSYVSRQECKGSLGYIPPELLNEMYGRNCDAINLWKLDVFSFGKIIRTCVTGREPWPPLCHDSRSWNDASFKGVGANYGNESDFTIFPHDLLELVKKCEHLDCERRPKWESIVTQLQEMQCTSNWINDQVLNKLRNT